MNSMKKILTLLAYFFCLSNIFSQTDSKAIEEQIKQVENNLAGPVKIEGSIGYNILDRMAFYKVKGLSIAVVKDYKIIWAKGYGWADESEKKQVTDKTMFQVASISKSINSIGIMKLVQDKKLDLTKDINDYLVSWKFPYDEVSKGQKITTLNLLTHTGGISNGAAMYIYKDTIPSLVQVLNGAKGSNYVYSEASVARSLKPPNTEFSYSNHGIAISQIMVSDITKKPYEQYIYETVFKPLGMVSSCYTEDSIKQHKQFLATGYNSNGDELPGKHVIVPAIAAGGLWTTPSDLARFLIEVQLSYNGKSNKVLSAEMVKIMLTPYIKEPPGFLLKQIKPGAEKYFGHSGSTQGFKGEYSGSFEGGNGVVVLINGSSDQILTEVMNSVATVYKWKDFYDPLIKKPIAVPDSILKKYVGLYSAAPNRFSEIVKKEDGLYQYADGVTTKMYFTNPTDYFNIEIPSEKSFKKDASGNIIGYLRKFQGSELFVRKIFNPDSLTGNADFYTTISWYFLENKNYEWALNFCKRLQQLNPKEMMNVCNIAHCYLFNNEYDKAIAIYKQNLDEIIAPNTSFKKGITNDFVFFKNKGFNKPLMDKVLADLKLEIPKEYKD
jgi:CubicO group peptidase (beta-lactamase class C family)